MIDSHCHIDLAAFNHDRAEVIASANKLGITNILVPGLFVKQFKTLLALQEQHTCIDIAFGFHPYFLHHQNGNNIDTNMQALDDYVSKYRDTVIGIGEAGLDGVISHPFDNQKRYLNAQLELASRYSLPIILHQRKSHNELIRMLKNTNFAYGGVIHAFSGSAEIAKTYVDLGFKLGIGGTITYARANKTKKAITSVGLDHVLLETDAPDMPLFGFQGQRNTPTRLPMIASKLAEILSVEIDDVVQTTTNTYNTLFCQRTN
ncbi:MAG: TatD family hydrolase [Pseudomonadota bacterium]